MDKSGVVLFFAGLLDAKTLPVAIKVLQVVFFLMFANLLRMMLRSYAPAKGKVSPQAIRMTRIFALGIVPLFIALFLYQGTWQLAGFMRPEFMSFMRRYDRRPQNPAHRHQRGRILDCNGIVMAGAAQNKKPDERYYPFAEAACHLIGYASPKFGITGIEKAENAALSGYSLKSSDNLKNFGKNIVDRKQIEGNDVRLTIDARLQESAANLLKGKCGAVVAVRPADGAILALASSPVYNPNRLAEALASKSGNAPLLNRALQGLYPPGSTFKVVVACEALSAGFKRKLNCPAEGFAAVEGTAPIRDHEYYAYKRRGKKWHGHGMLSLEDALVHSSNVFFAQLGIQLGPEAMNRAARRFRFNRCLTLMRGSSSQITAAPSQLPTLSADRLRSLAQISIGQGELLVTPLQMAFVTAVIANNGVIPRLHLNAAARIPDTPQRAVSAEVARKVRKMMLAVSEKGTARAVRINGLPIAAKTGTAQTARGKDHSWFICMAPAAKPEIAIAVIIEHGGYGSQAALPIARQLLLTAQAVGIIHAESGVK